MSELQTSHVLIFQGEVPEVVLCSSLDEASNRVAEAFQFDGKIRESFAKELDDDDAWTLDQSGNRFCFSTDIGEIETVTIYVVSKLSD